MKRNSYHATDRAYFKAHPKTNYRVRYAEPGEVDELARTLLPAGAEWNGGFELPEGHEPSVVVMKLPLGRMARFLTASPPIPDKPEPVYSRFVLTPIALGARVALA